MQHVWIEIPHEGALERTRYMEVPGGRLYLVTSTVGRAERMALAFVPTLVVVPAPVPDLYPA